MTTAGWPPATTLEALATKYEELERLRDERQAGGALAHRDVLRRLAARFPGALRELDTMELAEIRQRAAALREASRTGAPALWMAWLAAYHALFRITLGPERGEPPPPNVTAEALARIRAPDRGKRTEVVIQVIAEAFGATEEEVSRALLPGRRRRSSV